MRKPTRCAGRGPHRIWLDRKMHHDDLPPLVPAEGSRARFVGGGAETGEEVEAATAALAAARVTEEAAAAGGGGGSSAGGCGVGGKKKGGGGKKKKGKKKGSGKQQGQQGRQAGGGQPPVLPVGVGHTVELRDMPSGAVPDLNGTHGVVTAGPDADTGCFTVLCARDSTERMLGPANVERYAPSLAAAAAAAAAGGGGAAAALGVEELESVALRVARATAEIQECYARHATQQERLANCEAMAGTAKTRTGALLVWKTRKAAVDAMQAELDRINVLLKECPEAGHASNAGVLQDRLRDAVLRE